MGVALGIAGCARDERMELPPPHGAPVPPGPTPDQIDVAMGVVRAYLDASVEGSSTHDALPGLTSCPGEGGPVPGPMLARFTLVPFAARADTIVGRAYVTTVAEQDVDRQHPGYFVARQRIRSDTLEWDVLNTDRGYAVCNGIRFGFLGADSLTTWRPAGASLANARALADSVAALR